MHKRYYMLTDWVCNVAGMIKNKITQLITLWFNTRFFTKASRWKIIKTSECTESSLAFCYGIGGTSRWKLKSSVIMLIKKGLYCNLSLNLFKMCHWILPISSPHVLGITSKIWLHVFCSEQSCRATRQLIAALEGLGVVNSERKKHNMYHLCFKWYHIRDDTSHTCLWIDIDVLNLVFHFRNTFYIA